MSTVPKNESDSEDDSDYVPQAQGESESSDDEPDMKRARTSSPEPIEEDKAAQKEAREALWASFQASVDNPQNSPANVPKKMVKIEKRYIFAGEPVVEVAEVPEDSPDAKKWSLWRSPDDSGAQPIPSSSAQETGSSPLPSSSASTSTAPARPTTKRPGPRKPRASLAEIPTQKPRKLSTIEKSAMDWNAHLNSEPPDLKDELDANRRGGGYLEKVEFLERVNERKESQLEASKSTKRRR
ncbi:bucentaur or craniofacial development-domain-containing protein [Mycena sp. CBHHK59/15]|nr:bucentaur or craniofacial development-domain-containing protein [Mycena sp. CBHHK59/15]